MDSLSNSAVPSMPGMQGGLGHGGAGSSGGAPSFAHRLYYSLGRVWQRELDRSVPFLTVRWAGTFALIFVYFLRLYLSPGFYIITYGLGIYCLNLLIGFLSPQADPDSGDGPVLPTNSDDEFRPFERRLPEFKFWYSMTKAIAICMVMTLFPFLDLPVHWPLLLLYFIVLFVMTMKRQIRHMIDHKYVPFSWGKRTYNKPRPNPMSAIVPPSGLAGSKASN